MRRRKLRIATWNINSLRLRAPLLHKLQAALDPDVICLQETKVPDALFPADVPKALGYRHVAFRGMKGYNGVAVLSRRPIEIVAGPPDWCGKGDCRHVWVRVDVPGEPIDLHNFYVPAGGDIPDTALNPKFAHKLDFVAETRAWFAARPGFSRTVLVGDLNIAPLETDVWSHRQLLKVVSHTPPEVEALTAWQRTGFIDAVRHFVPAEEEAVHLVVVPEPGLARLGPWPAPGPHLGHAGPSRSAPPSRGTEGRPRLAPRLRPRAGLYRIGALINLPIGKPAAAPSIVIARRACSA